MKRLIYSDSFVLNVQSLYRFQTRTAQNPYPLGRDITVLSCMREYHPLGCDTFMGKSNDRVYLVIYVEKLGLRLYKGLTIIVFSCLPFITSLCDVVIHVAILSDGYFCFKIIFYSSDCTE